MGREGGRDRRDEVHLDCNSRIYGWMEWLCLHSWNVSCNRLLALCMLNCRYCMSQCIVQIQMVSRTVQDVNP